MATEVTNGLNLMSQRIQALGTPSTGTDAATKDYVDSVARGLDWKDSVRAASTGNVSIASAPSSIDGVTLANGDRVLLKDQTAGAENGIRVFTAAGAALARAVDADVSAEVTRGMATTVTEGTTKGTGTTTTAPVTWVLTTNDPITLNTTALVFAQVGGGGTSYLGGNGLVLTGSTFDVGAGTGIVSNANDVAIDTAVVPRKFAANIGNGALTTITVTHNLGTRDVHVTVYRNSAPYDNVIPDIDRSVGVNDVTITFATAPASNAYRVVVIG